MSDLLVELSQNPMFRQAVKNLGLPLPTPEKLRRETGGRPERPLHDRAIAVGGAGSLGPALADALCRAGADPHLVAIDPAPWAAAGEAFGRPARAWPAGDAPEDLRVGGLVFDGTSLSDGYALRALYDFFNPWLPRLKKGGRVVVLGRPPRALDGAAAAGAAAGLEGFTRSLAKELGRKGATANLVQVAVGGEARLEPVLRDLLSDRLAFVTGQPFEVGARVTDAGDPPLVRSLDGRTVLVTGAARGIGRATARALAAEGARVVCLDRPGDEGPLAETAREIGGRMVAVDITAADAPAAICEALADGVDGVVHNAGITRDKTLARMKPEWWDQAVAVNFAAVVGINAALLEGPLRDGARLVHLSSVSGLAGNAGQTNYSASKAALVGYVQALAVAVAGRGITVNAVAPGFIETRLTQAMPAVPREVGRRLSALGQGGEPRDVADLITLLCTPGSAGITGQTIRVCGGMFIGA